MKTALIFHVYYIDVFESVISNYKLSDFDSIYFTASEDKMDSVKRTVEKYGFKTVNYIVVGNVGYDLLPFLTVLPVALNDGIDLVCKLHTKKGAANLEKHYENIQRIWADNLYSSNLFDFSKIQTVFTQNPELSVLFPAELYKSSKYLGYGNEHLVTKLLSEIAYNSDPAKEVGFTAGTMFWAKTEALKPLLKLNIDNIIIKERNKSSHTGQFASYWHAIERLFGYLPIISKGKVCLSFATDLEHSKFYLLAINNDNIGTYINRSGVGIGLVSELYIKENYELLKRNIDPNQIIKSPSNSMEIDPILYYLRYGVFLGEELVSWFNSYSYWCDYPESINQRYNPLVHYFLFNQTDKILPATVNIRKSIDLIKETGKFDSSFYLRENPDVAKVGISPIRHFCTHGWKEGRDPSTNFELVKYHQDVFKQKNMNINPLVHYAIWQGKTTFISKLKRLIPLRFKIIVKKLLK